MTYTSEKNTPQGPPSLRHLLRRMFPWKSFIIGMIVPIALFYGFNRAGYPLYGACISIGWSSVVVVVGIIRQRTIDVFAAFGLTVTVIEFSAILITRSTKLFLASAAIDHFLYGLVFLVSLAFKKPLIQVFAEAAGKPIGTERIRAHPLYRSAWIFLTAFWGVVKIGAAATLLICQTVLSLEAFLVVRTGAGMPLTCSLLLLSYWFPGWYWHRKRNLFQKSGP